MKLVLTNFGQDISLAGEASTVYIVFVDEETGQTYRLPTVQDTITRLAQVLEGAYEGEPAMPEQAQTEPSQEEPSEPEGAHVFGGEPAEDPEQEDDENESEVPVSVLPKTPVLRKKITVPTSPTRAAIAKVRANLEDHQGEGSAEDSVPGL
jgi:hypothetical protein